MAKPQQLGVWTIAWGVFWGLMLWTVITAVIGFILWLGAFAAIAAAINHSPAPAPAAKTTR